MECYAWVIEFIDHFSFNRAGCRKKQKKGFKVVFHLSDIMLDDGYTGICFIVFTKS